MLKSLSYLPGAIAWLFSSVSSQPGDGWEAP